jgi:hypothetical protein
MAPRAHGMVDPAATKAARRTSHPWLDRWMAILHRVGNAQAWLLLSIAYLVLFLPLGLVFRLFNDPLRIRRKPGSTWQPFTRQYDRLDQAHEQS